MEFKDQYPDYAEIERHIRRAHLERSLAVSQALINVPIATWKGLKSVVAAMSKGLAAGKRRRTIPADAFLEQSLPYR